MNFFGGELARTRTTSMHERLCVREVGTFECAELPQGLRLLVAE